MTGPHDPAADEIPTGEPARSGDGPSAPLTQPRPGSTRRRRALVGAAIAACLLTGIVWRVGVTNAPTVASTTARPTSPADGLRASPSQPAAQAGSPRAPSTARRTALDAGETLQVKGRGPVNDYDRAAFGQAWLDVDRNGCDTRNDILRRDLLDVVVKPGTNGCAVLTGTLLDPYSGQTIHFVRGASTSSAVQIDHVVPLADAWQKGARTWSDDQRAQFANDPLNLLAVDGSLNQGKSAGDAATWLPPNRAYRCAYAARIVAVKVKYRLWVTQAEHGALRRVLSACPDQSLPQDAQ